MDIREKGMLVIGGHSNEALQLILSNGYMTEFVDEFKAWGYLDSGYALPEIYIRHIQSPYFDCGAGRTVAHASINPTVLSGRRT